MKPQTYSPSLCLVEPPSFVRKLENLSSLVGTDISLQCNLKGSEPMTVSWMKDGHELKEAEHIQISYENNAAVLYITDLQSKHGGKYCCLAQNQAGSQSCSALLTVKGWLRYLACLYFSLQCSGSLYELERLNISRLTGLNFCITINVNSYFFMSTKSWSSQRSLLGSVLFNFSMLHWGHIEYISN